MTHQPYSKNHILSADQFTLCDLQRVISRSKEMEKILESGGTRMCEGSILATLFYEPSTRTRLSFETAMLRLGGAIISETDVTFSSITKGEVIEDTIRIIGGYADIIALRTKHQGEAAMAAQYAPVPLLNGGDGAGEHPTQSLLDLYTISKHFNVDEDTFNVTFVGDLKYGRTVHSLVKILRNFNNISLRFIAPEELQIPQEYLQAGDEVFSNLETSVLAEADVVYDTRIQRERFTNADSNPEVYEQLKHAFTFDAALVGKMKSNAILMHPLPRVNEIKHEVDDLPQATYFEQAQNGVPVRMALIAELLGK